MTKALTTLSLALVILVAGCGGDDGSDSASQNGSQTEATQGAETTKAGSDNSNAKQGAGEEADGSSGGGSAQADRIKDAGGAKTPPGAPPADPEEFKAPKGGDDSIQTYGAVAEGEEEEAVIAAMRSFFAAMAASDYAAICQGITRSQREALKQFLKLKEKQGDCQTVLRELRIGRVASEARKAANGSVLEVRIEDENAFVLFTPEGGKASYFVMKREGDSWKSTGLSTGTPFNPVS